MTTLIKNIPNVKLFEEVYNNKNPENNENIILLIYRLFLNLIYLL